MLVVSMRALILFITVFISTRLMGKRELGQLQPFEFVIALMMADLAATPMANTGVPIFHGIIPILVLLIIHVFITWLILKSSKARKIICGNPSIIIAHGTIQENEMRRLRINFNDLIEQLHEKDLFSFADVEFAILETSGQLSVVPKASKRSATLQDLSISAPEETLPYHLIIDGEVFIDKVQQSGHDMLWLNRKLHEHGFNHPKQVLVASVDHSGIFFIQGRGQKATTDRKQATS